MTTDTKQDKIRDIVKEEIARSIPKIIKEVEKAMIGKLRAKSGARI